MLFILKIQVLDLHRSSYKFLSLIPYLASGEDIQAADLDWMRDLIDVPVSSRARVITGEVATTHTSLISFCRHILETTLTSLLYLFPLEFA